MGFCVEYPGQGVKQFLKPDQHIAVAVFTVTVLWKATAAMSSHPTICQRGCFSILGMGSEIHRPIHTSQIDMLAPGTGHYKHQLCDGTGICPAYCKFAGWLYFCDDGILCFQPQHLVFLFPFLMKLGVLGALFLVPLCSPIGYLGPVPVFPLFTSKCVS